VIRPRGNLIGHVDSLGVSYALPVLGPLFVSVGGILYTKEVVIAILTSLVSFVLVFAALRSLDVFQASLIVWIII
jgi:hypothetical protein